MYFFSLRTLGLSVLLFFTIPVNAQTVGVGQPSPTERLPFVLNYPSSTLQLADFKGKLVILDFWNHRCSACIESFSKLDSLQKKFSDQIQIILVNRESKDSTLQFFAKRKKIKMPSVPLVTGDTILCKLFPADGYPYHVWIDGKGVVRYMSGGYNTTAEHIRAFLQGAELNLSNPTLFKTKYGTAWGEGVGQKDFAYYSYLTHCRDDLNIGNRDGEIINEGKSIRLAANCSSVLDLYKKAYGEGGRYNFKTKYGLLFQGADSFRYQNPLNPNLYDAWRATNSYSYDLVLPLEKSGQRYQIMQQDLERYFDLEVSIEKKWVTSLILVGSAEKESTLSRKQAVSLPLPGEDRAQEIFLNLQQKPFSELVQALTMWTQYEYPFFDETGITGPITIALEKGSLLPLNREKLTEDLAPYGLKLREEPRLVPVLVIREKKSTW